MLETVRYAHRSSSTSLHEQIIMYIE